MFSQSIPHTREGTLLASVMAIILRATPWLRVEGVLTLGPNEHLYALCVDERRQIVVGFDTLASWQAYIRLVGAETPESEVTR